MHVVVVSQYFPPETGGTSNRLGSLVEGFVEAGHEVTVIAEKPAYPGGIIWDEYRGGFLKEAEYKGARVLQVTILENRRRTTVSRIAFFLSFVVTSVIGAFRIRQPVDVVVASSPPLFVGLAGWIIARTRRARFVFDVRDLWPGVAVAMGELSNPAAINLATRLEHFIYKRADVIAAVTDSFCEDIKRIVPHKEIHRVTNGTVPEHFRVSESKDALRRELGLADGFLAAYVGNIGLAQGLDHIVEAARLIDGRDQGIHFLIVGGGSAEGRLASRVNEVELSNLELRGRVDVGTAARYMAAADVLLVPLGDHPIYKKFIPSKLFDSMAAGRPLLLSVDGEARRLLEQADAGWYYPAQDAAALVEALLVAKRRTADLDDIGRRGRGFVEKYFTRAVEARRMVALATGNAPTTIDRLDATIANKLAS